MTDQTIVITQDLTDPTGDKPDMFIERGTTFEVLKYQEDTGAIIAESGENQIALYPHEFIVLDGKWVKGEHDFCPECLSNLYLKIEPRQVHPLGTHLDAVTEERCLTCHNDFTEGRDS